MPKFVVKTVTEKSKMENLLKKSIKATADYNASLMRERYHERRAYFDLQTFVSLEWWTLEFNCMNLCENPLNVFSFTHLKKSFYLLAVVICKMIGIYIYTKSGKFYFRCWIEANLNYMLKIWFARFIYSDKLKCSNLILSSDNLH